MHPLKVIQQLFNSRSMDDLGSQYYASPGPLEMLREGYPPGKKYLGWKVDWTLTIETMNTDINPNDIIVLTYCGDPSPNIYLTLHAGSCPEVFNYGTGCRVKVRGEVKSIHGEDIYLENCLVEFVED